MKRSDLVNALEDTLQSLGGGAGIAIICKEFWRKYGHRIKENETLFYTWQYDIRWAATQLRKSGIMKRKDVSPKGVWELN